MLIRGVRTAVRGLWLVVEAVRVVVGAFREASVGLWMAVGPPDQPARRRRVRLGQAVQSALAGALAAGTHRAAVDARALAPGVYLVRVVVNTAGVEVVRAARLTVAR